MMRIVKSAMLFVCLQMLITNRAFAQNPFIKCYFNHPVNTSISSGVDAIYLNGTFADTVAAYINRAKYTVDIAIYNFTSGSSSLVATIATAANNAYLRGVILRWIYNGSSTNSGLSLLNPNIRTLASPTTSGYGIMHDKFMVIDVNSTTPLDAILMTGSTNWSTTQTKYDYNNIVVVQDQPVALAYYNEFNKMWGGTDSIPNMANAAFGNYKTPSAASSFVVNGTPIEVYFSPKDDPDTHLKSAIATADNELFFGIYTFTDNTVANAIKARYNSGLSVKGIIDQFSHTYSPFNTLSPVLGTNMIEYAGNYLYHNKMIVIDGLHASSDPQVLTGSYNWSYSGANSNDENTLIIHDSTIANQYLQSLCQDFAGLGGTPCTSIFPVQLVYFTVQMQLGKPMLQWAVASQKNMLQYVIEKGADGTHYTDASVSQPTNSSSATYHYKDTAKGYATTYYRLRMVGSDGSYTHSKTISVKASDQQELQLYPNPVGNRLVVQWKQPTRAAQRLQITDMAGKVLLQQTTNTGSADFNTTTLSCGTYLLLTPGTGLPAIRFVKQ